MFSEQKNLCVWAKDNAGMGSFYRSQHELVAGVQTRQRASSQQHRVGPAWPNRTNVWRYAGANSFNRATDEGNLLAVHPTVKPVRWSRTPFSTVRHAGISCSIRFLGSGTTLMAAERVDAAVTAWSSIRFTSTR